MSAAFGVTVVLSEGHWDCMCDPAWLHKLISVVISCGSMVISYTICMVQVVIYCSCLNIFMFKDV